MKRARLARLSGRYERWAPPLVFTVGFVWDTVTMTRVDSVADHILLLTYSATIGAMILLTLRRQAELARPVWVLKLLRSSHWEACSPAL
jgi:hypothetical protein